MKQITLGMMAQYIEANEEDPAFSCFKHSSRTRWLAGLDSSLYSIREGGESVSLYWSKRTVEEVLSSEKLIPQERAWMVACADPELMLVHKPGEKGPMELLKYMAELWKEVKPDWVERLGLGEVPESVGSTGEEVEEAEETVDPAIISSETVRSLGMGKLVTGTSIGEPHPSDFGPLPASAISPLADTAVLDEVRTFLEDLCVKPSLVDEPVKRQALNLLHAVNKELGR